MKKVGSHRTLPLKTSMWLSREIVAEMGTDTDLRRYVIGHLTRPRIPRWLVGQPVGEPRIAVGETPEDFMMNRLTALAEGRWDAVYIGRRNRPGRRRADADAHNR